MPTTNIATMKSKCRRSGNKVSSSRWSLFIGRPGFVWSVLAHSSWDLNEKVADVPIEKSRSAKCSNSVREYEMLLSTFCPPPNHNTLSLRPCSQHLYCFTCRFPNNVARWISVLLLLYCEESQCSILHIVTIVLQPATDKLQFVAIH